MDAMRRRDFFQRLGGGTGSRVAGDEIAGGGGQEGERRGISEEEARELTGRILSMSRADATRVSLSGGWEANTRYAVNRITTSGTGVDLSASIEARFGRRSASVTANRFDDDALREAVRSAEELARLAPEDPEQMPLLGPREYRASEGYHEATAGLEADARGQVAADAIGRARETDDLEAAGFLETSAGASALADSEGLFAWHPSTSVDYTLTVRTPEGSGSGWAGAGHRDWSRIDTDALHRRAVEKARRSRDPRPLEPGDYTVVLEPAAVGDLVGRLAFSLGARQADEGRSAFAASGGGTRVGERIVDPRVSLESDPQGLGSAPFSGDGLPRRPVTWIEDGVLRNLYYSRYWAQEQGVEPTGFPTALRLSGGEGSLEDLIAGTERGVLVTRFWYIRSVDPRTILYTGLTRDGTFLIEDGEISHPVNNFRWNESPLFVLDELDAMSAPVRIDASLEVPALRAREFTFSSVSEAV